MDHSSSLPLTCKTPRDWLVPCPAQCPSSRSASTRAPSSLRRLPPRWTVGLENGPTRSARRPLCCLRLHSTIRVVMEEEGQGTSLNGSDRPRGGASTRETSGARAPADQLLDRVGS